MLYIFSGLPGTGKSELSKFLAEELGAVYLRIDTIEQGMRKGGWEAIDGTGYSIAQDLARDNLRAGLSVVSDSVNPFRFTREDWRNVATGIGKPCCDIEVRCSCETEHKKRIESRVTDVPGLVLPSWEDVLAREYHSWKTDRLVIDTAGKTPEQSKEELLKEVSGL